MNCVQGSGGRRGHPRAVCAHVGMDNFLRHHVGHQVGFRPHAFADLRLAGKTRRNADIDVGVFVSADPGLALDGIFRQEWTGEHAGVDLIAGAVEETGVDEKDAVFYGANTFFQIHGGAAFFIHHTNFDRVALETKHIFDGIEQVVGKRHFFRAMHFGLDDVDTAFATVLDRAVAFDVVKCT